MSDTFTVGAAVFGPPTMPRVLVRHNDLFQAYADGRMAERGETTEAYLSHFVFGPDMQNHYAANRQSVAGFAGPHCCRWLVFDIDQPDLAAALVDARRLVATLQERYGTEDVPVWFSGSKGFHLTVELAHAPLPSENFHRVARTFAGMLAAQADVMIDQGIYDLPRIIRMPNTRHPKTGLFKRRLDADALLRLSPEGVRRLAEHAAGDGLPPWDGDSARLAIDWREAEAAVAQQSEARAVARRDFVPDGRAPKYFLDLLRFGVPQGERHLTLFRAAAWLTEQGAPPSLCYALLTEAGCDIGLSPKDVERQIRCGIEHAQRQRAVSDACPDPIADPDAFERWCIQHENDPLPDGALDFPFGALASPGGPPS